MKKLLLLLPFFLLATPYDEGIRLYKKFGGNKYMIDEMIVQTAHVLQAAYHAKEAGAPEEIIVALLFHDVGQLCIPEDVGNAEKLHPLHAERGGQWLKKRGFPERVWKFVRYHDLAKIVLCSQEPAYYDNLSRASQISYAAQKASYERHHEWITDFVDSPYLDDWLAARRCDDLAKDPTLRDIPPFAAYAKMTQRVLDGKGAKATNPHWKEALKEKQHARFTAASD